MKIFYVTPEAPLEHEGELLSSMIAAGAERIHLRHPHSSEATVRGILDAIPQDMRSRVMLHDFHHLAADYGCGIHLNRRNPEPPEGYRGEVSCSCHSLEEVESSAAPYCFLSPMFDSISKVGYKAARFDASRLRELLSHKHIVALGGVTPERFDSLRAAGFTSVALSGYLTGDGRAEEIIKRLKICINS